MKTLYYFPLEPIKSRYTHQLCTEWMPDAFYEVNKGDFVVNVLMPDVSDLGDEIQVGQVLDATGRGIFSMRQVEMMLDNIRRNNVTNDDVIFLQDFFTPGFPAVIYALAMFGLHEVRIYSMLHAQSVDPYDFTYPMRDWMRGWEICLDRASAGIFVASTVHKLQLREAGFASNIHVVSLPISVEHVEKMMPNRKKENLVVYCSRLDWEKQPLFMLEIAATFLAKYPEWRWVVTSSQTNPKSNYHHVIESIKDFELTHPRFRFHYGLEKEEYYDFLSRASIQFNCSLQDYVSWTLLESCIAGCDIVYPNFNSFPECVPDDRLYKPFEVDSALAVFDRCIQNPKKHMIIPEVSDQYGRIKEAEIILYGNDGQEYNIWQNRAYENDPEL